VWVKSLKEVLGAGGTHGELCVRFAAEDVREPIIKDNLLDDDILRMHMEKNRMGPWFQAAMRAGKLLFDKNMHQQGKPQSAAPQTMANGAPPEMKADMPAGEEMFDGDDESAPQDVEMQG
jgi:nuclear pore complex protein Nup133